MLGVAFDTPTTPCVPRRQTHRCRPLQTLEPRKALQQAGATTEVVAPKGGTIRGWNHTEWGQEVGIDRGLQQADPEQVAHGQSGGERVCAALAQRKEAHMKFRILATLTAAAPLALAASASPDTPFYRTLAEGGMFEVDLGRLAEQNSTNRKVKDFAEMMVKDHSAANQKLQSLAATKDVPLPKTLDPAGEAMKSRLQSLSGSSFDKAYIESQLKAHEKTVNLLEKEITSGEDAQAKAFAQSVLPTIQHHLEAVRTLANEEGVKGAQQ
jgi:putative membrane protein